MESTLAQQPVEQVTVGETTFTLLGTAHVSRASAEAVREMLGTGEYDTVAVELCDARHQALSDPDAWKKMDLFQIIRQGKGGIVAANLALGAYQRRLAEQFGIEPGAEMKAALDVAEEKDLKHALIDRNIGITFKRVFRKVGFLEKFSLFSGLLFSLFSREEITEEEIEKLKEGDMLESTFSEFAMQSEKLYASLIAERDEYMAAQLLKQAKEAGASNMLVVIGAGHLKGTLAHLREGIEKPSERIEKLDEIPPPGMLLRALPWLITAAVLTGFGIGFARSPELGAELVLTWILINGTLAAIGAAAAGAHPLTIVSGFVAAPITSLNPAVAAGMATAAVETWLRKPTVGDFSRLRDDVMEWTGWWKNRVSRILLVLVFSNLGSMAGTWIAGFKIFDRLS